MSTNPETDYDALAAWAQSDEPTIQPGTKMIRGTAADHDALRAMLEAGAETEEEKALLARARRGRPSLDPTATPGTTSPMWRVRAPGPLDARARARAEAEERDLSALVRQAVEEYLTNHAAS
ncbi:hypothetical protein [Sanguibacter antarcticus]|uniref:Ribbon-helix-helix CopG family protein n=1 Tax=Sanguibacter antarcticus TaxID=372484 RepID=A0A2A9E1W8_9MICO|nr:hypothetical protein [Sanguibacter antarcticus]PFG33037.1 hypothetical protein ATL42_0889 [Sanguibacter antarcticus]